MTSLRAAAAALPLALLLAACGGGSTASESSSAPDSSSAAADPSATSLGGLSPECTKAVTAVSNWFMATGGIAMSLTSSPEITPEVAAGMAELATQFDSYASDIETAFPDAPASYTAFADVVRGEAAVLRTWPDANTTTDGLAKAIDDVTTSDAAQQALGEAIPDLEARCAPWQFG